MIKLFRGDYSLKKKSLAPVVLLAWCFLLACTGTKELVRNSTNAAPLHYKIQLEQNPEGNRLRVTLTLPGEADGTTAVYTPFEWGPAFELDKCIQNIRAEGASLLSSSDGKQVYQHAPGAEFSLHYQVISDVPAPMTDHNQAYRPVLRDSFFHFLGDAVFIYPVELRSKGYEVNIEWIDFPEDWDLHNSFARNQRKQKIFWKDTLALEAFYTGGRLRTRQLTIENDPVYVLMLGDSWNFSDVAFHDLLQKTIRQQRQFWNDYDFPYYTVTLFPFLEDMRGRSYMGTAIINSFILFATPNVQLEEFHYLCNHEMMHEWIGRKIKTAEPEAERYWFSEGFTDYFTYINMRENGLLDEGGYVKAMNKVVLDYHSSPVRDATNAEMTQNFFSDYNSYGKLAYHRGCLFATYVDWKIRAAGNFTLKDAMQALLEKCKEGTEMTDELFLETMNAYLAEDLRPAYERYIQKGEPVELGDWMLGPKVWVERQPLPVFEMGFDVEKSLQAKKIIGLKKDSNAYEAGLRENMPIRGYSFYTGQLDVQAEIQAEVDGEMKSFKYYPVAQSRVPIPQFLLEGK